MNGFDSAILTFVNGFAHKSWLFDTLVVRLTEVDLAKGVVFVALLWWEWFRDDAERTKRREILFSTLIGCFAALFACRTLAALLPYRERPLRIAALHFQLPFTMSTATLISWSSFPSDHAALFFGLAAGLLFTSRVAGSFAMTYALFIIGLPRIYTGIHYPTDILVGALFGIAVTSIATMRSIRAPLTRSAFRWLEGHPSSFYAVAFLVSFQIATLFYDIRLIGNGVISVARALSVVALSAAR